MTTIIILFIAHWYLSLTFQTLFLHRYASHGYYKLGPVGEKLGHLLTWVTQGPSYLSPYAYGILHKAHHSYSDTNKDPHSPHHHSGPVNMMLNTAKVYNEVFEGTHAYCKTFTPHVNNHHKFDQFASNWITRISVMLFYTWIYTQVATHWSQYLLLPIHFFMGPLHGFIVNWFGHWAGYRNTETPDESKNTLAVDLFLMGELYQNNHHAEPNNPNFARKWWELDIGHWVLEKFVNLKGSEKTQAIGSRP